MKRFFIVLMMMVMFVSVRAQEGNVTVKADARVDQIIALHKEHNQAYPFIQGYRIQLFKDSGNDALDAARERMDAFKEQLPGINVYLSFEEPYYRVRVGDFRTRIEALNSLEKIKKKYRNVWIIKDNIRFSDYQNQTDNNIQINNNQN